MELTFSEIVSLVPGLIYAVFVVLIYRDGLRQINEREDKLRQWHKEELDRLRESYIARVEGLQSVLERFVVD
jgi:hypothetical protein